MNGPQSVRILVRGGKSGSQQETVTAGPTPVPGLLVNEDPTLRGKWNITHAASGAAVAGRFDSPEHALHIATKLAGVCDWTMSASEMRTARYGLKGALLEVLGYDQAHHLGDRRSIVPDSALEESA